MRETVYESVEALQANLDAWLVHHTTERPHLGYRNMGGRPVDAVVPCVSQKVKWTQHSPEALRLDRIIAAVRRG